MKTTVKVLALSLTVLSSNIIAEEVVQTGSYPMPMNAGDMSMQGMRMNSGDMNMQGMPMMNGRYMDRGAMMDQARGGQGGTMMGRRGNQGMPMMMNRRNGQAMPMMKMMQDRHASMEIHRVKMEKHLKNIEALLQELVNLQKAK